MRNSFLLTALAASVFLPFNLRAQSYSINWYTVAGGGGTSAGGNYSLSGTIGQPATSTMSGGNYSLTGGFWSLISAVQTPGAPLLSILSQGNNAVISWDLPASGFVLEETANLAATNWSVAPVTLVTNGSQISVTVPAASGYQFYRLHTP